MERKPHSGPTGSEPRAALGVIDALSAGFDLVLRRPWVLGIPIVLDLFLWLGPRAQAPTLYQQVGPALQQWVDAAPSSDARFAMLELSKLIQNFFAQFNLFSWLSAGLLGVPVVNGSLDATAPLVTGSAPLSLAVADFDAYFLLTVACGVAGLLLTGLYWALLANSVRNEAFQVAHWIQAGYRLWRQVLLLVVLLLALALMSILPMSMAILMVGALSAGLAPLIPMLVFVAAFWLAFYCSFTLHGLSLYHLSLGRALRLSALVVRLNFVPTLALLLVGLAIYVGMGVIWDGIPVSSALRLIAIVGHAITGTGVLLASLVFYQNRSVILFERFHWPMPSGS